jgi:glycosyltransferase involved in cell wall biosynthesis
MVDSYEHHYVSRSGEIDKILKDQDIKHIKIKKLSVSELKKVVNIINPDIIQAHDFRSSFVVAGLRILHPLLVKKIKIISHLHNNDPRMTRLSLCSLLYFICSFFFNHIVVVSPAVLREYIFSRLISRKTSVIYNTLNLSLIKRKSLINIGEKSDIIFIARFTAQKDPLRFVKIISKLIDIIPSHLKVMMIGEDEGLKEEVKQYIKNLGISNHFIIKDFQSNPYPYIKSSSILVLTSKYEGFGLVALEAMYLGKPVVCTNVGGLVDIVTPECGYLCISDRDFEDEIIKLLNNNKYYQEKSIAAIKRAKEIISNNEYREQWEIIYK